MTFVRRELRRVSGALVDPEQIRAVLQADVIKRDALEGDKAIAAARQVTRATNRAKKKDKAEAPDDTSAESAS